MYNYTLIEKAPRLVECWARTHQGHRIIWIALTDPSNPRITAFNETSGSRTPAQLYFTEIIQLITEAHEFIFGDNSMEKCTQEVKSKSKVVGEANFNKYDTVDEARESLGEDKCLSLINAQVRTNAMNEVRAMATSGPSKGALRSEAVNELVQEIAAAVGAGETHPAVGNKEIFDSMVETKMNEIKARMAAAAGVTETDDEDEDEEE